MPDFIAEQIVKTFQTPAETLRILDGVDLQLDRGQNVAITGESGSGKSTLLHIAGTLDTPTSGSVTLLDQSTDGMSEKRLAAFRNRHVGFIFQQHHLLPQLTATENVLIPLLADGAANRDDIDRAIGLLESVGLQDRLQHRPSVMSGGECQRVAVARALIRDPVLLLADEPTGSLDGENAAAIGELLIAVQQRTNAILICVTHSDSLANTFERALRLERGKLVA